MKNVLLTSQQQPPAQEWPKMGRNNGPHRLSSPRTAYIGPELWTTPTLKPKNGLYRAGAMDHTNSQAQERPISGRNNGSHQLSSPKTDYIGPEQWITPTLKPKNGLKWAGTMDRTDSQAQERPISGQKTSAKRSADSTDGKARSGVSEGRGLRANYFWARDPLPKRRSGARMAMTGEAERSGISKRSQHRIGAKQQGADTCYTQA